MPVVCRNLLFAEPEPAADIVRALEAVTDTHATWDRFIRLDGSETDGATVTLTDSVIEVHVGAPSLPATLELEVDDLPAALERLLNAGFAARTSPNSPDQVLNRATVTVGDLTLVAVAAVWSVIASAPGSDVDADRPRRSGRTSTGTAIEGLVLVAATAAEAERQASALAVLLDVPATQRGEDVGQRWEAGGFRIWQARDGEPATTGISIELRVPTGVKTRIHAAGLTAKLTAHGWFSLSKGVDLLIEEEKA